MKNAIFTFATLLAAGCSENATPHAETSGGFSQAEANRVSDECGADRSWLQVRESGEVMFQPSIDGDYDAAACVLQRVKNAGVTNMGFVGNEKAPEPEGE